MNEIDRLMMARCHELARQAGDGNTPVGSVVAVGPRILADASEQSPAGPAPFAHAELLAVQGVIQMSGRTRLPEATLYTTHEPCFLCSYAIRTARISRVVIGIAVPGVGGVTSRYPILAADDISGWEPPPAVVWISPPPRSRRP